LRCGDGKGAFGSPSHVRSIELTAGEAIGPLPALTRPEDDLAELVEWLRGRPGKARRSAMAWTILIVAGVLEIGWAVGLKYTDGFTRLYPTIATVAAMVVSMTMLGIAVRDLPVGTAYAVWTGIGTAGTALLGILLLGEAAGLQRLVCIGLIVAGIVGLKLGTSA
jgi:quaternary ammonium compound-resistance protein SugE